MILFEDARAWRSWLESNHDEAAEAWLLYFKKHTGKKSIVYEEALDEALCYGWIDTTVRRVDDDSYAQRWTPRKKGSKWSEVNKGKVARLLEAGRMTPAGLAAVEEAKANGRWDEVINRNYDPVLPPAWAARLHGDPAAATFFQNMPPGARRQHLRYVLEAKQEATRARRFETFLQAMHDGKRLKAVDPAGER